MIPIESLLTFIAASALLALSPGPDNIFVLTQSALHGRKSGVWVTLGLCSGLVVHTSAVALGVAVIIQTSLLAFSVLKIVGALYLLYLAWQAFKASSTNLTLQQSEPQPAARLYLRGVVMNVTNPKVTIFFLAFLPQFTSLHFGPIEPQIFILGGLFMLATLVVFSGFAFAAGLLLSRIGNSVKAQAILNRSAACIFTVLAVKLLATDKLL